MVLNHASFYSSIGTFGQAKVLYLHSSSSTFDTPLPPKSHALPKVSISICLESIFLAFLRSVHPGPCLDLCLILHIQWLDVPDTVSVFVNATVTAEEAHASNARDALGEPCILVLVCLIDEILCFEV